MYEFLENYSSFLASNLKLKSYETIFQMYFIYEMHLVEELFFRHFFGEFGFIS